MRGQEASILFVVILVRNLGHDEKVKMYSAAEGKPVDIVSKTFASLSFRVILCDGRRTTATSRSINSVTSLAIFHSSDFDPKLMIATTESPYLK